jgi:hypothetical protein
MRGTRAASGVADAADGEAERYFARRGRRLRVLDAIAFIVDLPAVVGVVWLGVRAFRSGHAGDRFRTSMTAGSASFLDFGVVIGVAVAAAIVGGLWSWIARRRGRA